MNQSHQQRISSAVIPTLFSDRRNSQEIPSMKANGRQIMSSVLSPKQLKGNLVGSNNYMTPTMN